MTIDLLGPGWVRGAFDFTSKSTLTWGVVTFFSGLFIFLLLIKYLDTMSDRGLRTNPRVLASLCALVGIVFMVLSVQHIARADPATSTTKPTSTLHRYAHTTHAAKLDDKSPAYKQRVAAAVKTTYGLTKDPHSAYYSGLDGKGPRACNLIETARTATTQTLKLMCDGTEAKHVTAPASK